MSELFQDSALLQEIDRFVEEQKDSIVRDIGRLVAIPSVESEPEPGAPYGPGPRQALDCALGIAADSAELLLEFFDMVRKGRWVMPRSGKSAVKATSPPSATWMWSRPGKAGRRIPLP